MPEEEKAVGEPESDDWWNLRVQTSKTSSEAPIGTIPPRGQESPMLMTEAPVDEQQDSSPL